MQQCRCQECHLGYGDGMGWEMTRAGAIAKRIITELKGLGCDIVSGCASNTAVINRFTGRTLSNYYVEGMINVKL
jgi:hypothetical protein